MILTMFLYFIIISGSVFFAVRCDWFFERTLPLFLTIIILFLYFFGLINALFVGVCLIIVGAALLYVIAIFYGIKHQQLSNRLRNNLFTSAFWAFTLFFVIALFANYGEIAHEWDEFTHWMPAVRSLVTTDQMVIWSHDNTISRDYPPGTALFQYLFARCVMLSGEDFPEWTAYLAIQILAISMLFPLFRGRRWKGLAWKLLAMTVLFVFPLFFYYNFYSSIYVDAFLGMTMGGGMAAIIVLPCDEKDGCYHMTILLKSSLLAMCKRTGFVMATLLIGMYLIDLLFTSNKNQHIEKMDAIKKMTRILLITFLPLLIWHMSTWIESKILASSEMQMQEMAVPQVERGSSLIGELASYNKQPEDLGYRGDVIKNYIEAFFDQTMTIGTTNIEISFALFIAIIIFLLYTSYMIHSEPNQNGRVRSAVLHVYIVIQIGAWLLFFLTAYLFVFGSYEGLHLASFTRYIKSGLMPACIIIVFSIMEYICRLSNAKRTLYTGIMILVLWTACPIKEIVVFAANQYPAQAATAWVPLKEICKKVGELPDDNNKIFFLSQGDEGKLFYMMKYYCVSNNRVANGFWCFKEQNSNGLYGSEISADEFMDLLIEEGYNYLIIHETDEYFRKEFKKLFSTEQMDNEIFFVDTQNRQLSVFQPGRTE